MAKWLFKADPEHYSFEQLVKEGKAVWSGVRYALAQRHLRAVQKGDEIFFYETGNHKAVVGIMRAISNPCPDPEAEDPKFVVLDVAPVRRLKSPVPLARIKASPELADFALVRLPRLSVLPVTDGQWAEILRMLANRGGREPTRRFRRRVSAVRAGRETSPKQMGLLADRPGLRDGARCKSYRRRSGSHHLIGQFSSLPF
jgi:predicted RNA-binding protein with PUA-like domain